MAMTPEKKEKHKKTKAEANINRQIDTKQQRCQCPPYDRYEE